MSDVAAVAAVNTDLMIRLHTCGCVVPAHQLIERHTPLLEPTWERGVLAVKHIFPQPCCPNCQQAFAYQNWDVQPLTASDAPVCPRTGWQLPRCESLRQATDDWFVHAKRCIEAYCNDCRAPVSDDYFAFLAHVQEDCPKASAEVKARVQVDLAKKKLQEDAQQVEM